MSAGISLHQWVLTLVPPDRALRAFYIERDTLEGACDQFCPKIATRNMCFPQLALKEASVRQVSAHMTSFRIDVYSLEDTEPFWRFGLLLRDLKLALGPGGRQKVEETF